MYIQETAQVVGGNEASEEGKENEEGVLTAHILSGDKRESELFYYSHTLHTHRIYL